MVATQSLPASPRTHRKAAADAEPVLRKRYVGQPGRQIHLLEGGSGDLVNLWCLHATAYSGRSFAPFLQAMARRRPVTAADTPGYGDSDPPAELVDIAGYARRLDAAIDAAGAREVHLLGYHTGAVIAAELARLRPDRVRRLVLIGVPFFEGEERALWRKRLASPTTLTEELRQFQEPWDFLVAGRLAGVSLRRGFDNFVDAIRAHPDGWWAHDAAFTFDLATCLREVRQPTLVLNPANHLSEASRRAAALIPGAKVVELSGLNGSIFDLAPEDLADLTEAFLRADGDPKADQNRG